MSSRSPWLFIGAGFALMTMGWVLPFLMVLHVLPSTLFLNFFSYIASVLGLFLGVWGAVLYAVRSRRR